MTALHQHEIDAVVGQQAELLEVEHLCVELKGEHGWVRVVDDVSFSIRRGEVLALVGESGSGKSMSSLAIMGLLPKRSSRVGGSCRLNGVELIGRPESELRGIRGAEIAMIFQDPMTSLNPVFTIGNQIGEVIQRHQGVSRESARRRAIEALEMVGIPQPERRIDSYPHEFSGGMRQRAMIAAAISCSPSVLIADEATTALDVTVQAQILDLIRRLGRELRIATLLVTHDMGVVADLADDVAVMYAGQIVERQRVHDLFAASAHPYTESLLGSMPQKSVRGSPLRSIPGSPPLPSALPPGCRFAPRCRYAVDQCGSALVELVPTTRGQVRCIRRNELELGVNR